MYTGVCWKHNTILYVSDRMIPCIVQASEERNVVIVWK